jgi:hypothetical protein
MIRSPSPPKARVPDWHVVFLRMVPAIRQHARFRFRHLDPENREECIQETICNACCAVARLAELNRLDRCRPHALARFAVAQVKDGRRVGSRLNCEDVSSPYCQRRKGVVMERLDHFDTAENTWKELIVQDRHTTPAEVVRVRIDFAAWLKTLSRRSRRVAELLAVGHRAVEVARRFHVSRARVSQLRWELYHSWQAFVGEPAAA